MGLRHKLARRLCTVASSAQSLHLPSDVGLFDFLRRAGDWSNAPAEQAAFKCGATGAEVLYSELEGRVLGAAHALRSGGFRSGDVMSIHMHNCNEWPIGFLAIAACGGTSTPSNPLYTSAELANQLTDSGATCMLTSEHYRAVAEEAAAMAGLSLDRVAYIEDPSAFVHAAASSEELSLPRPVAAQTDLLTLPYSSGTTGKPKGVMLSHFNVVANALQVTSGEYLPCKSMRIRNSDRLIAVLPLYHIYGMCVLMIGALLKRASVVLLPRFEPTAFLEAIQTHRITKAHLVPPVILFLAKHEMIDSYDLSSLETVFSGAAPLDQATCNVVCDRLGVRLSNGYGLTEVGADAISMYFADPCLRYCCHTRW